MEGQTEKNKITEEKSIRNIWDILKSTKSHVIGIPEKNSMNMSSIWKYHNQKINYEWKCKNLTSNGGWHNTHTHYLQKQEKKYWKLIPLKKWLKWWKSKRQTSVGKGTFI